MTTTNLRLDSVGVARHSTIQKPPSWRTKSSARLNETVARLFQYESQCLASNYTQMSRLQNTVYLGHFEQSKRSILEAAKGLSGNALVLGIGGAHDIPIAELAEQFDQVDVVDVDLSLMDRVIEQVSEQHRSKIHVHKADLSGYLQEISEYAEDVAKRLPKEYFCAKVIVMLPSLQRNAWNLPGEQAKASFVVSSLLSSQLSNGIINCLDRIYGQAYLTNRGNEVLTHCNFSRFIIDVEMQHLLDLQRLTAKGGRIYFAREATHILPKDPLQREVPFEAMIATASEIERLFRVERKENWVWENPCALFKIAAFHLDNAPSNQA